MEVSRNHHSQQKQQAVLGISKILIAFVNTTLLLITELGCHLPQVEASSISSSLRTYAQQSSHYDQIEGIAPTASHHVSSGDALPREIKDDLLTTNTNDNQKPVNNLETNALIYLQKYGYMNVNSNTEANRLISEDSFSHAISSFQRFASIPETGTINEETLKYMQLPRCGNSDKPPLSSVGHNISSWARSLLPLMSSGLRRRKKRYALQGSKWRRQELTYRISQYPSHFSGRRHEVDAQIEKAFGIWSQVAPINFVPKKDGRVHIDIRFASGDHGDGDAFDGPGNTLAHAYFPQYGGDAHFDDQEYWTIDSYAGTNIFQVAAHELGHSLGLGHSNVREALMAPFYQKYKPNFKLHIDDVLAIQALYGEKPYQSEPAVSQPSTTPAATTTTTTTAPTTTTTGSSPITTGYGLFGGGSKPNPFDPTLSKRTGESSDDGGVVDDGGPVVLNGNGLDGSADGAVDRSSGFPSLPADLCQDPTIDAVTRTEDGSSYVFKGDYYWLLTNEGLARGYPRRISTDWDGLPGSLDAALTWADGKTFFFKGNKYWRFRNRRRDIGYPKLISAGFAGIPDDIDAAFVWSGNGRTYIFKGANYWRFDSKSDPPVSSDYPRSIKIWQGIPAHINAAFRWENNVTYFFKGSQYYRFNDKEFKVESRGRPAFPRASAEWWFGCSTAQSQAQRSYSSSSSSGSLVLHNQVTTPQDSQDWSFLAGLEENTRIMGTHISDHRPGTFVDGGSTLSPPLDIIASSSSNNNNHRSEIGPNAITNRGPTKTISLRNHHHQVSSSAISILHNSSNQIITMLLIACVCSMVINSASLNGRKHDHSS